VISRGVVCVILRLAVLIHYGRVTHTHTDTHTDRHAMMAIGCRPRGCQEHKQWRGLTTAVGESPVPLVIRALPITISDFNGIAADMLD